MEEETEQEGGDQSSREYGALMTCSTSSRMSEQLILAPYSGPGAVKEMAAQSTRSPNSLYKLLQRLREADALREAN